jgi:hypothetical protein
MSSAVKPHLSFWQILNMNVGFFGIQFSFGLQQSQHEPDLRNTSAPTKASCRCCGWPGPITGLLVQPIDRRDERPHRVALGSAHAVLPDRRHPVQPGPAG